MKVLGAAMHVAGDTYAHRTVVMTKSYPLTSAGANKLQDYRGRESLNPDGEYIDLRFIADNLVAGGKNSILYNWIAKGGFVTQRLDYSMKYKDDTYADDLRFYPKRYTKGTKTAMQEMLNSWEDGDTTMSGKVIKNRGGCPYSLHKSATYLKEAKY